MRRVEIALLAVAASAAAVFLAFWPSAVADYAADAGPSIHPLAAGHLHAALAHVPAMGWFSILLRAPFAFLARHGTRLLEYRLGVLPCTLAAAALGVWLAARMRRDGRTLAACALVAGLAVLGAMNWHAVVDGHPEELLGGALCVAAVLVASSGRSPVAAGVVLGLALATKQWAILAFGPALLAAPRARVQIAAAAMAVGGVLTIVPAIAGPHHLVAAANSARGSTSAVEPASIWWPLGQAHHIHVIDWTVEARTLPQWLANLTHPLIVVLGLLLSAVLLVRRRPASTETALTLLSMLFLLRCVLDPMTIGYYHVPLLLSLLALEALYRRGAPLIALASNAVLLYLVARVPWGTEPGRVATIYLAWALPLAAYLAGRLYAPRVMSDLGKWLRTSLPSSVTTTRSSIRTPNAPGM